MKAYIKILIILGLLLNSCTSYLNYESIQPARKQKSSNYNITLYHQLDPLPPHSSILGILKVDNAIPTVTSCNYEDIIELAKWKARNTGGDAIHITNIILPDETNNCYSITANIIAFDPILDILSDTIDLDNINFKDYLKNNIIDPIEPLD